MYQRLVLINVLLCKCKKKISSPNNFLYIVQNQIPHPLHCGLFCGYSNSHSGHTQVEYVGLDLHRVFGVAIGNFLMHLVSGSLLPEFCHFCGKKTFFTHNYVSTLPHSFVGDPPLLCGAFLSLGAAQVGYAG